MSAYEAIYIFVRHNFCIILHFQFYQTSNFRSELFTASRRSNIVLPQIKFSYQNRLNHPIFNLQTLATLRQSNNLSQNFALQFNTSITGGRSHWQQRAYPRNSARGRNSVDKLVKLYKNCHLLSRDKTDS